MIGLVFAVAQFVVSEMAYQAAMWGEVDVLYEVSDTVSWPAGRIYDEVELRRLKEGLRVMSVSGADEGVRAEAAALLARAGEESFLEDAWLFADTQELDVYMGMFMEYLIYGGTCLMWGVAVGVGGFVLSAGVPKVGK